MNQALYTVSIVTETIDHVNSYTSQNTPISEITKTHHDPFLLNSKSDSFNGKPTNTATPVTDSVVAVNDAATGGGRS